MTGVISEKTADTKMEVDEEEEEDPLDAFMKDNTKEVKKVNEEDLKRFGGPVTEGPRAEVLNEEDDGPDEDEPSKDGPMTAEDILALAAKKAKKKDLPVAQHSKITYEPFRKKFYTPNQETNDLDEEDVELIRMEMDGIKIRGADCPKPVRNWGAFGLPAGCYDVIKKLGYTAPTSIQAQAIPAIMSGRDIIGVAKTGSGKTIAFLLPLFRHIKDQRPLETGEGPMALIMTPTRELATQIWRESKPFLTALNMRVSASFEVECQEASLTIMFRMLAGCLCIWRCSVIRTDWRYEEGGRGRSVYPWSYDRSSHCQLGQSNEFETMHLPGIGRGGPNV
jgi:ATP-dependent RNA helicase DDX46/PRP5